MAGALTLMKLMAEMGLDAGDFAKGLKVAEQAADASSKSIVGKLAAVGGGVVLGAFAAVVGAGVGLAYVLKKCTDAAATEQVGIMRLAAAVKASGGDWNSASGAIEKYLATERRRVALDDGEGRDSLARLTTDTGSYLSAMRLLPLVVDLARSKNLDMASASEIVGKVAQGNVSILTRYGIKLREGTSAVEALTEMEKRFAGQGEAFANTLEGQRQILGITITEIKEGIGNMFLPLATKATAFIADLLQPIEEGIRAISPLISDELLRVAHAIFPAGANITESFAKGIAGALPYVVAAVQTIGGIITYLLKPGSPPKLLPRLTEWGTGAANAWFKGWTQANYDILGQMTTDLSGILSGMVAQGALRADQANPLLRGIRAQIARAINELNATGSVSARTLGGFGRFGRAPAAYARAYLGAAAADQRVTRLEAQMAATTSPAELTALATQYDAAVEEAAAKKKAFDLEKAKIDALRTESTLMERIAAATDKVAKSLEKATKGVKPATPEEIARKFGLLGPDDKIEWSKYFDPAAISEQAKGISEGWMAGITPTLDSLRELVAGAPGLQRTGPGGSKVTYGGKMGLFGGLSWWLGQDWKTKLVALKIPEETITSWQNAGSALVGIANAINAVTSAVAAAAVWWAERTDLGPGEPIPGTGGGVNFPGTHVPQTVPGATHASGLDTVLTRATYLGEMGIGGEGGPERLTLTPLGRGGSGRTQVNHFHFYGLGGMTAANAARRAAEARLWS